MEKELPELLEALASFNNYYKQNPEDVIRVDHGNHDVRDWSGNDFFEEGFKAGMRVGIKKSEKVGE